LGLCVYKRSFVARIRFCCWLRPSSLAVGKAQACHQEIARRLSREAIRWLVELGLAGL
jgi:hypothetical protein